MGETAYQDWSVTNKNKDMYAAKACVDYSITVDGVVYDDWFLPSKDELNLMYENLYEHGLGPLAHIYWSSSEYSSDRAWNQYFEYGTQRYDRRSFANYVRPIRAFE